MEEIEDEEEEDSGDLRLPHLTPTLVKKVKGNHTPAASPNVSGRRCELHCKSVGFTHVGL